MRHSYAVNNLFMPADETATCGGFLDPWMLVASLAMMMYLHYRVIVSAYSLPTRLVDMSTQFLGSVQNTAWRAARASTARWTAGRRGSSGNTSVPVWALVSGPAWAVASWPARASGRRSGVAKASKMPQPQGSGPQGGGSPAPGPRKAPSGSGAQPSGSEDEGAA